MFMLQGIRRISLADVLGYLQGRGAFICFFVCACVCVCVQRLGCSLLVAVRVRACSVRVCVCVYRWVVIPRCSFRFMKSLNEVKMGTSGIRLPHPPRLVIPGSCLPS